MNTEFVPIKKRIDEIVKLGLHPHLKSIGFKKRGRTFRRQSDDLWHIASVSGGMHNTNIDSASIGSFGIEVGIHFPKVYVIDTA